MVWREGMPLLRQLGPLDKSGKMIAIGRQLHEGIIFRTHEGSDSFELRALVRTYRISFEALVRQIPSMKRGRGYEFPPLAKELLECDSCWEREKE